MRLPYLDFIKKDFSGMMQFGYNSLQAVKKNGSSMFNRNDTAACMKLRLSYLGMLTYCNCSR
jgi:hypothetical protein